MINIGIIGYPLKYTLSPQLHNFMFKYFKIDGEYKKIKTLPKELKSKINYLKEKNFKGVNITTPFKERIINFLDQIDVSATDIQAVNTIVLSNGKLTGFNTDTYGFKKSLEFHKLNFENKNITLLGTGGAAKAVASIIKDSKPNTFIVIGRNFNKTKKFAKKFNGEPFIFEKTDNIIKNTRILINATPVEFKSLSYYMKKGGVYYDLKYNITKENGENSVKIINGLIMLIYQGIESFYLWNRKRISIETIIKKGVVS